MALIITRFSAEFSQREQCQFRIGDDVLITIINIKSGNSVRIAIQAPKEVTVHREEIYQRVVADRRQAGKKAALAAVANVVAETRPGSVQCHTHTVSAGVPAEPLKPL